MFLVTNSSSRFSSLRRKVIRRPMPVQRTRTCACLALLFLPAACVVQVSHPTRTRAEQERDIKICDDQGYYSSPNDALLAMQITYDCLEAKGYKRGKARPKPL